jgi:YesN/AraC family two-component response regulator
MLEAIKTLHSKPLVIVTSAHSESEYIAGAIKVGVEGYILKPFDFEQLNNELLKVVKKVYIYKKND